MARLLPPECEPPSRLGLADRLGLLVLLRRLGRDALVLLPEPLDAARSVYKLVLTGEERMTGGADLDVERAAGGTGFDDVSASADDARGCIHRMNVRLHVFLDAFPRPGRVRRSGDRKAYSIAAADP